MGSFFSKILKVAAPVALSFALPGLGTAIGAGLGATTAAGQAALGGAVIGGGLGGLTGGGIKGALQGAALGGVGGYIQGSGGLGKAAENLGMGRAMGTPLSGMVGPTNTGSGLAGMLSKAGNFATSNVPRIMGNSPVMALGNIYSGIQGTQAAKDVAKAQQAANAKALALQSNIYNQTTQNMNPFLTAGQAANTRLAGLLGLQGNPQAGDYGSLTKKFSMEDFTADPGYQYRLEQGTKAMNQSLGARGNLFSGEALKAAQSLGQELANQTYNDAYTRYVQDQQNAYNKLAGTSAQGQSAAANQGAVGANYANQAGALYGNQGDIAANKINAQSYATNQGLAGLLGGSYGFSPTGGGQSSYAAGVAPGAGYKVIGYKQDGTPIYG